MTQAAFDQFQSTLETRLQAGNQKWDQMQLQINEASKKWEQADEATTQAWRSTNERIDKVETGMQLMDSTSASVIQQIKDTIDHLGSSVRENADQLQFIHGDLQATIGVVEQMMHTSDERWNEADRKYIQDMKSMSDRVSTIASSGGGGGGGSGSSRHATLIDPKFLTINQFSGSKTTKQEFDGWRDGLESFINKIFPNTKKIMFQLRKVVDEVNEEVFNNAA